jgi:hypothetical protein
VVAEELENGPSREMWMDLICHVISMFYFIVVSFVNIGADNVKAVSNPGRWGDIVELLVPELQKRGLYWEDYPAPGGTLRENMGNNPREPLLAEDHPGSKFKWNAHKKEEKAAVNDHQDCA